MEVHTTRSTRFRILRGCQKSRINAFIWCKLHAQKRRMPTFVCITSGARTKQLILTSCFVLICLNFLMNNGGKLIEAVKKHEVLYKKARFFIEINSKEQRLGNLLPRN
ncbi:hypothetical protein CVS40_6964 [Lucilia cuprina]|nr:hypothetical protein CVS40_6964 [Lucilia cuprina]